MAGRFFGIPFAATGDRAAVPDAAQPDGSVSFTTGFGFDYERPSTDPTYKPVPREGTNGLYHDITQAIGIMQRQGVADFDVAAQPYAINALVRHNNNVWRSLISNNTVTPAEGASWAVVSTSGRFIGIQTFVTPGISTYSPSPGTNSVIIEVIGGGGAGGGAYLAASGQLSAGGGGGSGSYARKRLTSGFAGVSVTVGAGGVAQVAATGLPGGSSSFGALVSCPGGLGGTSVAGTSTFPFYAPPGNGGEVSSGGDINTGGSPGEIHILFSPDTAYGGNGGPSFFMGPGGRNGNGAGFPGRSPGAGGGGACRPQNSATGASGGAGSNGIVIIWEYS